MNKIGLFYGSNLGTTMEIAERIKEKLGDKASIYNIAESSMKNFDEYNNLIFGTSTWGYGELQDDWQTFIDSNPTLALSNKKIAIFGLGDQDSHQDVFVNGIGKLFDYIRKNEGEVIGFWPTESYEYGDETTAIKDDLFLGLPLDEINQPELTEERINKWLDLLLKNFS